MGIVVDSTAFSTVVYCDVCIHWVVVANSHGEGLVLGARHESRVHPNDNTARKTAQKHEARARRRAAEKTRD